MLYVYAQVFGASALALSVDKEFSLGVVGIDKYRRDLTFASSPVPMGQDVECFSFGVPVAAVEVVAVLGQAGQVDDAEE